MEVKSIIEELKKLGDPVNLKGMGRYGINTDKAFGVKIPLLRQMAKTYKNDHSLALKLWETGYHEARLIAIFIDDPKLVTEEQMENWVLDFNSWDICDQACSNLFDKTPFGYKKALEWATRDEEFVKRAGFAMMAMLAVHDKKASDDQMTQFFPFIEKSASDKRNFVKKAVNWALRQIGKRNMALNLEAIVIASRIKEQEAASAKWIATDALKELHREDILERLVQKEQG